MENIKPTAFVKRPVTIVTTEQWRDMHVKGVLDADQHGAADDWIMISRERNSKYGRAMYSKKLDQVRCQTMGEFYGDGIVD